MKILILANNDVGLYKFRKELLERLLADGHEVLVCLPYGPFVDDMVKMGCRYLFSNFERRGTNPWRDLKLLKDYITILKIEKPNIVFTYTIKPNVYGGIACRIRNIPYVTNITGLGTSIENKGLLQLITLNLYKIGVGKAKKVFFQNTTNRDFMISHGIINSEYEVLPGSGVNIDDNKLEAYPSENDGIKFLFIGRIMKDKGIEEYLAAARIIKKKFTDVKFDIIGDYDDSRYQKDVEAAVAEGIVGYFGFQKDVHKFIAEHHATVLPTYHEGLSNVLLETAATGRCVIASNIPGCRETFDDGITGIGFEPQNVESLSFALEKFLGMPRDSKKQMGLAGRKKIETQFDRNIVINKYIKIIQRSAKNV